MKKLKKVMMMVFVVGIFLVPVVSIAGSLEPIGAPAPTMKTLDQIPPTWSIKLPATDRFVVLVDFNNEAVLDKETGLVWQQTNQGEPTSDSWTGSLYYCIDLNRGGRMGWRLPTVEELLSLVDPSQANPPLPSGHPFNISLGHYWTSTSNYFFGSEALIVGLGPLFSRSTLGKQGSGSELYRLCVRGQRGLDGF